MAEVSSDDEPDYMSEEFLASCVKDVRPGLVFKHSTKRQFQLEEDHRTANEKMRKLHKPAKVLEAEKREEGLNTAISSANKGFAMLQKMGYNPGKGLGPLGEGRTEPVAVELKVDRAGLGREAAVRGIVQRKLDMLAKKIADQSSSAGLSEFRNRKKDEAIQRLTLADVNKSRRMCQALDEEKNIAEPAEPWFWPERKKEPSEEEEKPVEEDETKEEENQLEPVEQLELLTSYLRQVHLYCIWCGAVFDDENDLSVNCPGMTRDDH